MIERERDTEKDRRTDRWQVADGKMDGRSLIDSHDPLMHVCIVYAA